MSEKKTLGLRIQYARKRAGMTQQSLAEALHTNASTVWAWEHDRSRPGTAMLMRLANALQVPVGELNRDTWL